MTDIDTILCVEEFKKNTLYSIVFFTRDLRNDALVGAFPSPDAAWEAVSLAEEYLETMQDDEGNPFEGFLEQVMPAWAVPLIGSKSFVRCERSLNDRIRFQSDEDCAKALALVEEVVKPRVVRTAFGRTTVDWRLLPMAQSRIPRVLEEQGLLRVSGWA